MRNHSGSKRTGKKEDIQARTANVLWVLAPLESTLSYLSKSNPGLPIFMIEISLDRSQFDKGWGRDGKKGAQAN